MTSNMHEILEAAREAERAAHEKAALAADIAAAATKHREQVEKEVEVERRPKILHDGKLLVLSPDATRVECWRDGYRGATYSVDFVRALASLLPRKPVEVTEKLGHKAVAAYERSDKILPLYKMIDALKAVASDLSAHARRPLND